MFTLKVFLLGVLVGAVGMALVARNNTKRAIAALRRSQQGEGE